MHKKNEDINNISSYRKIVYFLHDKHNSENQHFAWEPHPPPTHSLHTPKNQKHPPLLPPGERKSEPQGGGLHVLLYKVGFRDRGGGGVLCEGQGGVSGEAGRGNIKHVMCM